MKKWQRYSEKELKQFYEESLTEREFFYKMGYACIRSKTWVQLQNKYSWVKNKKEWQDNFNKKQYRKGFGNDKREIIINDRDSEGNLKINLSPFYFHEIQEHCGIYLLVFPNEMSYIGQSSNLSIRIYQHFLDIMDNNAFDWHQKAHWALCESSIKSGKTLREEWFCNVKLYMQYTESPDIAKQFEREILFKIYQNKRTEEYYNTQYFIIKNGEYKITNKKKEPKKVDFSQYLF